MNTLAIFCCIIIIFLIARLVWRSKSWIKPDGTFPPEWRVILLEKVAFYNSLTADEKTKFEYQIQEFLLNCRITGIGTTVEIPDKILVAASAVIPIFGFDGWKYSNLDEVLIYPGSV